MNDYYQDIANKMIVTNGMSIELSFIERALMESRVEELKQFVAEESSQEDLDKRYHKESRVNEEYIHKILRQENKHVTALRDLGNSYQLVSIKVSYWHNAELVRSVSAGDKDNMIEFNIATGVPIQNSMFFGYLEVENFKTISNEHFLELGKIVHFNRDLFEVPLWKTAIPSVVEVEDADVSILDEFSDKNSVDEYELNHPYLYAASVGFVSRGGEVGRLSLSKDVLTLDKSFNYFSAGGKYSLNKDNELTSQIKRVIEFASGYDVGIEDSILSLVELRLVDALIDFAPELLNNMKATILSRLRQGALTAPVLQGSKGMVLLTDGAIASKFVGNKVGYFTKVK